MMSSTQQIELLDTLFYVGLVATIVFLILAVIMFFAFKIPQIYMLRTGKAQRKTIEKMQKGNSDKEQNSADGQGANGISQIFGSSAYLGRDEKTAVLGDAAAAANGSAPAQGSAMTGMTEALSRDRRGDLLNGIGETTILSLLVENEQTGEPQTVMPEPDSSYGKFVITRYMIKIHTNEVIV